MVRRQIERGRQGPHQAQPAGPKFAPASSTVMVRVVVALPDEFVDYACGTNGGPPSLPLTGWSDYKRCRPEPSGAVTCVLIET